MLMLLYGSAQYVGSQKHFKKYSAFELRGRNQNSDKWVQPRIEFCVVPIFAIFEYSVFEILIGILDIFFGPARARGSQLGSRRAARRDRVRARYAESRVCRPWFLAVYFVMNAVLGKNGGQIRNQHEKLA